MLLAGNLVGMGFITSYVWGINHTSGIYLTAVIIWLYTVSGGHFSVAYADVFQSGIGWSGCIVASYWTIVNTSSYLGSITRFYWGPDSVHAEFETNTCSTILGLPTCGAWVPDSEAFIKLMTNQVPPVIGAWSLAGIIAASMSTASGAILAVGTVFSHNIMRQPDAKWPSGGNDVRVQRHVVFFHRIDLVCSVHVFFSIETTNLGNVVQGNFHGNLELSGR
jgi:Na+/proline symporter